MFLGLVLLVFWSFFFNYKIWCGAVVWLPAFVGHTTEWLSSSFMTLFLKLEGHLGECVCLTLRRFGGEAREANSEFLCARVLMYLVLVTCYLFWISWVKDEEKGKILTLPQAWILWPYPKPWTSAISNSLLLLMKEGVFLPYFFPFLWMAVLPESPPMH